MTDAIGLSVTEPEQGQANAAARHALDDLRRLIEVAAAYPDVSRAMALSRTVVWISPREDPSSGLTIMLDRDPIEVLDGRVGEPESEIEIGAADLKALAAGELQLAIAIAKGRVSYRGTIRKFLRAAPIMRRAARLGDDEEPTHDEEQA